MAELSREKPVHFIGIGGVGMSPLAELLLHVGLTVTGSDAKTSPTVEALKQQGATIYLGQRAENIADDTIVVYSTAIKRSNPEYQRAEELGLPLWHRSELLQALLEGPVPGFQQTVGLSGTHGKTTLTGMVGWMLEQQGQDPTIIAGGKLPWLGSNLRKSATNQLAVAELDESDGTIVRYKPSVTIVSNLELDHADHYEGGQDEFLTTFETFFKGLEKPTASGEPHTLILNANCPRSYALAKYGIPGSVRQWWLWDPMSPDKLFLPLKRHAKAFKLHHISPLPSGIGYKAQLWHKRDLIARIKTNVPGLHNVFNAAQAILAGYALGLNPQALADSLQGFTGMGRRFDRLGQFNEALLIDDYAHHPTEITVTLQAARLVQQTWQRYKKAKTARLVAFFQPHRYSRLEAFWDEFLSSLSEADTVYVLPVYSAGEDPRERFSSEAFIDALIKRRTCLVKWLPEDWERAHKELKKFLNPGDLAITLGAGSVTQLFRTLDNVGPVDWQAVIETAEEQTRPEVLL